jgi:hypothetical protein
MSIQSLIREVSELAKSLGVDVDVDHWGAALDAPRGFTLNATDLHCATLSYIGGQESEELWREIKVELDAGLTPCGCEDCLA